MCSEAQIFNRVERLVGADGLRCLKETRVIVFGIGGVGSWTAEALVRSGIEHLTIVDADRVAASNINRQLMATTVTVGKEKTEVLKARLLEINPQACIETRTQRFTAETAGEFDLAAYDFVVDAIDSIADKALLIKMTTDLKVRLVSSMGAALKMDPTRVRVAEFNKVQGCRLAAALRRRFRKTDSKPRRKFQCVYSDELLPNLGEGSDTSGAMTYDKVAINGALCHITAIFGMTLAGLVIEGALRK